MRPIRALLAFVLLVPAALAQPTAPPDLAEYVAAVQAAFEVPGVAVAIVKDGQVVVAEGFGVRELGAPGAVTSETLFGIASNSKAVTGTALGMLVEEGKIEWDRPVVDYLPWFQMADPYVTRELTVRDLLVHRSGLSLGAGDLLWWPETTYSSEELVRRLRHLPLSTSFRSTYAYDNVLYVVAGEVIRAVTGQSWEEFVAERILEPLGMRRTVAGPTAALAAENVALPHAEVEGAVRRVEPYRGENANAAAGLYADAEDVATWMMVQLDSGRVAPDRRIFEPETARELWSLVTPIPVGTYPPELAVLQPEFNGYALGFFVRDYRGHRLLTHTGGLPGYLSQLTLIPALRLGVAVLTNQESGAAFNAITYHALDHYVGDSGVDWLGVYLARAEQAEARLAEIERRIAAGRDSTAAPSLPLAAYAGTYRDPWYGDVVVSEEGGGLEIRFAHTPWLEGELVPWQHDTFLARWHDRAVRADAFVTFSLRPSGAIDEMKIVAASPRVDFSFDFQDLRLRPVEGTAAGGAR